MAKCLSSSSLNSLKCEKCKNYLSAPPIIFTSDKYFCGRCKATGSRARAYETLAKEVLFPCIYDKSGCKQQLSLEKTLEHEAECEYATILCPSLNCSQVIGKKAVLEHFQKTHQNLLVKGEGFSIPKKTDSLQNRGIIVNINDQFYLIQIRGFANSFFISLKTIFKKDFAYSLVITSKNGNKIVKKDRKSTPLAFDDCTVDENRFSREEIESVLGSPDYTFEVKISGNEKKDENLLEDFECIVCQEYMIPPIYICKRGHSLCDRCKKKISVCPVCRSGFQGARNFALEKLAERVTYPCRNRPNCRFTGNVNTIKQHEKRCGQKTALCPLRVKKNLNCGWSGPFCDIYQHSREDHSGCSWMELDRVYFRNITKDYSPLDCQMLTFDDNNFLLSIDCEPGSHVNFKMDHIELKRGEYPKYYYNIELIDSENSEENMVLGDYDCVEFDWNNPKDDDGMVSLCIEDFEHLLSGNGKLFFKIIMYVGRVD